MIQHKQYNRCGGHIELIRCKEYYGIIKYDPIYSLIVYALFGPIFLQAVLEKDVMGSKNRCAVFGCNNDRLFPLKYTVNFSFFRKSPRKYWVSAPGHPIILLKSNKFNMAAVPVKRCIPLAPKQKMSMKIEFWKLEPLCYSLDSHVATLYFSLL